MANSLKKRGQKFLRKFSRASLKASEEGKEHIKENLIERISHIRNIRLLIFEWGLLAFALIMLAITQAFWFADSYSEDSFTTGGTYTEATIGEVNSMNPLFATTNSEKVLSKLMFATITSIDHAGKIGNQLAKSITPSEGGKKWTVILKDNLKWSDGEPITSDDVIFTAKLIKNPAVATIYDANLSNVEINKGENGEIIFNLPTAYADFASALDIPVVPEHILGQSGIGNLIENAFSNDPVVSGAFDFNALQINGNEKIFYLQANDKYYLGRPTLNTFAVHVYNDKNGIINALRSGAVTATAELSESDVEKGSLGQFNQKNSSLSSGAFIFFNTKKEYVKDTGLRAAIRQGIDIDRVRVGAPETIALNYPLTESQIKISAYPGIPSHNYEEAKAKIAELSGEEKIHLEVATVNSGCLPAVTNALAEELENLGFDVNVSFFDENQEFIVNIISKRNYDILVYEVELGAEPDLLPYYHSSQASAAGLNLSNYRSALVDDLLLGARDTLDTALRVKKYESFLEQWVADVPAIALYQPNLTYYYNKNIRTFNNNLKLVTALDRFSDVIHWAVNKTTKNQTP